MVIFISPNAVEYGLEVYKDLDSTLTKNCKVAAIGTATAQALEKQGINSVLTPKESPDSEGFLRLPELEELPLKTILIIKGVGGRTLLQETLSHRGMDVFTLDTYERILPDSANIQALSEKIDLILFTSNEIVQNFLALIPESLQKSLLNCQTIVGHPRIAEKVTSLGFKNLPIIATSPADGDMLSAITQWVDKNGENQ